MPDSAGRFTAVRRTCGAAASGLALAVATPLASLTGPVAERLLLAVILLDIPVQFETSLAFRDDAEEFGGLSGFSLSVTTLALLLLYCRWAMLTLTSRGQAGDRSGARLSRPLVLYLAFAIVSAAASADIALSLRELLVLLQAFLIYVYLVTWMRTREDIGFVTLVLLASLAFESVVMFYAAHVGETSSLPGLRRIQVSEEGAAGGILRVGGTVGAPNSAAAYLTLLIAPAVAVLFARARFAGKVLAAVSAVLALGALVLTQSRGGWLAALISLTVVWFANVRPDGRWIARSAFAAALIALVLVLSQGVISNRLSSDDEGAAQSRLPLMRTALEIIRDHPLLGVGPNNYGTTIRQYGAVYGKWGDWVYTVHNKFLLVWAETGVAGLIAFVWFLAETIRLGWRGWQAGDPWLSPLALGFTAALIGHVAHMQVDLFNARPQVEMLWVTAAVVAVIAAVVRDPHVRAGVAQ